MFKSLTVVSLVAATAYAQSSSFIPAGISSGCSTFLSSLNTNADLAKCTGALAGALSPFAPGSSTASSSAVTGALTNLCSDDVASNCPATALAASLTQFSVNCAEELKSNDDVIRLYDVLYTVTPLREAICSKDDAGNFCVSSAAPVAGTSLDTVQKALYTQQGDNVVPNADTFSTYNLPFLFLSPASANLCEVCTRNVLNAYIKFESGLPHAAGLGKSKLLSKQTDLFTAVQEKCGADFMVSEVAAAGGLGSNGIFGSKSGALPMFSAELQSVVAAFAALAVSAVL